MKIKELGLEEKINFKNTLESTEHRDFHLKQTGRTTVPCMYIDGKPMFESNDISNWLEKNIKNIL
jgi:glutaredoxin